MLKCGKQGSLQTVHQVLWGQEWAEWRGLRQGWGRSWDAVWLHHLRHPPFLSSKARWPPVHQGTWQQGRHRVAALGFRSIVGVGQRRQGLQAGPPPHARWGLHAPLLFIFTQNVSGFFCIPQGVLSIFFLQPLPVLKQLKRKPKCHMHLCRLLRIT